MDLAKKMPTGAMPSSSSTLPLALGAAALRHLHLFFALASHLLFDRIFNHRRTSLDVDRGIRVAVSIMVRLGPAARGGETARLT